ncbi:MlaD family protein [Actinomadura luteofluorescens]|uniref:MlaD family protein n=1 Tax=Actinomadura luteofluorescens TaxID=46163 RepID=UPI00363563D8
MAVALGLAMTASLGGCSLAPSAGGERTMVVYVPKARSFYEESKVKVMGADVGLVDKVENQGDRVKVTFHLRRDVPLPKGVQASIVPLNLIGERNLVLHPAWRPGRPRRPRTSSRSSAPTCPSRWTTRSARSPTWPTRSTRPRCRARSARPPTR